MGLIFLILVSVVLAVIVFTILDRNSTRVLAVVGSLVTLVVTFGLPFGVVIGAVITLGVFAWAFSRAKEPESTHSTRTPSPAVVPEGLNPATQPPERA